MVKLDTFDKINNFNNQIENNNLKGLYLYKFYATWCGHCKNMQPEWEKFLNNNSHNINIVEIEAEYLKQIDKSQQMKFNVQGYPSLLLFNNNNRIAEFSGERTANNFNNFIKTSNQFGGKKKSKKSKRSKRSKNLNKKTYTKRGGNLINNFQKLLVPATLYAAKKLIKNKHVIKSAKSLKKSFNKSINTFISNNK